MASTSTSADAHRVLVNDLAHVDSILSHIDNVRYALPAAIRSLAAATAAFTPPSHLDSNEADSPLHAFRAKASASMMSIRALKIDIDGGAATFDRLDKSARADQEGIVVPPSRKRSHPFANPASTSSASLPNAPPPSHYPSAYTLLHPSPTSPSSLRSLITTLLSALPGGDHMRVSYPRSSLHSHKRRRTEKGKAKSADVKEDWEWNELEVELEGISKCQVRLRWVDREGAKDEVGKRIPMVDRVTVFGPSEEKLPFEQSDFVVFRWVTLRGMEVARSTPRSSSSTMSASRPSSPSPSTNRESNFEAVLSWLSSYHDLYERPCARPGCRSLLSSTHQHLPPTWRMWLVPEPSSSKHDAIAEKAKEEKEETKEERGEWTAFHRACWTKHEPELTAARSGTR